MAPIAAHPPAPKFYFAVNAAALLAAAGLMILLARAGGYSVLRLALIGLVLVLAGALAGLAAHFRLQPEKESAFRVALLRQPRLRWLTIASAAAFALLWFATWFPPQFTRTAYYYFIALYPLILCALLAAGSSLILLLSGEDGLPQHILALYLRHRRTTLITALAALLTFALIAWLTARLRILASPEPFWYGAGVPILAGQVFIAVLVGIAACALEVRLRNRRLPLDLLLFLLIWAVTAAIWAATPVPESYWVTAPRPPNRELYPFSDMITFDVGSQFALIGQGIFNNVFWDRALYMAFLVYLHTLGGQNYQTLMSIQAALFAVFPAILYLVGRRLHTRTGGLMLAVLASLRGMNSVTASTWIDTATFKHMLTDFPTAIAMAIFVLLLLRWLESPRERGLDAIWAAGVLGLSSLLRTHVLVFVPLLILFALWVYRRQMHTGVVLGSLCLLAFLAGAAPWMLFGPRSGSILNFYGQRIHDVIVQRYPQLLQPQAPPPTRTPSGSHRTPAAPGSGRPAILPVTSRLDTQVPFVVAQYMHNLVNSGLIFPYTPEFLSVKEAVKGDIHYWIAHWNGGMNTSAAAMLVLNLAVVALGMGAAVQRRSWRGPLPLAVMLVYQLANSLARTSGGRYLVPTDWIVVGYFSFGLAELILLSRLLVRREPPAPVAIAPSPAYPVTGLEWKRAAAAIVGLALIGGLVPLAGIMYPRRYADNDNAALIAEMAPHLASVGLSESDVTTFLAQPGAAIVYGRALYPRFYQRGTGEPTRYIAFTTRDFPRAVMVLIGPRGYFQVILPGPLPKILPDASDAIVLGCRAPQSGYELVDAVTVILPQRGVAYGRSPASPLTCPLRAPVCDNNGNCR